MQCKHDEAHAGRPARQGVLEPIKSNLLSSERKHHVI